MTSIGAVLDRHRGLGPGFDFVRVTLAIGVTAWHANYAVLGNQPGGLNPDETWILWLPGYARLVMLFGLSGFLIAASAARLGVGQFAINRGLRILPPLTVEVVLSALVLGPIFTTLTLGDYFSNPGTYLYFKNILGSVNYFLPGVFTDHPTSEVNNALWTVPFEYACYAVMAGLMAFGLLKRPALVLLGAAGLVCAGLLLQVLGYTAPAQHVPTLATATASPLEKIFGTALFLGRGARLLVAFMLGAALYLYRHRIPYDPRIFAACAVLCAAAALAGPVPWMTRPVLNATLCPAIVYMTVFLGVTPLPRLPVFSRGDYSYGIYLYGFPVQQAIRACFPTIDAGSLFGISMVAVTLLAALSWHLIERPILRLRRRFSLTASSGNRPDHPFSSAAAEPAPVAARA